MDAAALTAAVKALALEEGFIRAAVAPAGSLPAEALRRFDEWLAAGGPAGMDYLRNHADLRAAPDRLVPGARSVLCLAMAYGAEDPPPPPAAGRIARYARGRDYHKVLKARCHRLMDRIRAELSADLQGRAFVDSAPVMERSLAAMAGLGWIGRHGCLIAPGSGSWVLLAEVVSNLPLVPDAPSGGDCGACRRCVDACPTGALTGDGRLRADRCLSYWNKRPGPIPADIADAMGPWLCGCDLCQEACPHNGASAAADTALRGDDPLGWLDLKAVLDWSRPQWDHATRGRGVRVVEYESLLRNAIIASGNSGCAGLGPALRGLMARRPDLKELVQRALARLGG